MPAPIQRLGWGVGGVPGSRYARVARVGACPREAAIPKGTLRDRTTQTLILSLAVAAASAQPRAAQLRLLLPVVGGSDRHRAA